jgi:hypothetical protein
MYPIKRGKPGNPVSLDESSLSEQDGSYWEIALTGHTETQLPHSMQVSWSTFALPSTMLIASTGQFPTHVSHPTHASESTFAFAITYTSLY